MHAQGTLYLSRTRPSVQTAADGTFALILHALDRIAPHQVEPWVVLWCGPDARAWWQQHSAQLVPGAAIGVQVQRMRSHVVGRALPEIHAVAQGVVLLPSRCTGDSAHSHTQAHHTHPAQAHA